MAADRTLNLIIDSATNLQPSDVNGKSDPYVAFQWRGQKYKTATVLKTLTPSWKQSFSLSYQPQQDPRLLRLELWDKDRITCNDPIGKVEIDLTSLQAGVLDKWYPIAKLYGQGKGQLRVIIELLGGPGAAGPYPHRYNPSGVPPPIMQGAPQAFTTPTGGPYPHQYNPQFNPPMQQQMSGGYPNPYSPPPLNQQFGYANQHPSGSPGYQHMNSFSQGGMPYAPPAPYGIQALPSYGMPHQPLPSYGMPQQPGLPWNGIPQQPLPSGMAAPQALPSGNCMPQANAALTMQYVREIQRIVPTEREEEIKAALGRFDGDKEKALSYLINQKIHMAVQQQQR